MKTRIIKTKFWADKTVQSLSPFAKLLFIYLLTSPYISLTCYFELTDGQIMLDTSLEKEDLGKAKKELEEKNRVFFYNGWIFIPNLDKHNAYKNSPKTRIAYEKELTEIPKTVLDYFNRKIDSSIYSSMDTTPKTENIKHKTKNINPKEINKEKVFLEKEANLKTDENFKKFKEELKKRGILK